MWIVRNIHRLMVVSGLLTLTMVYAAVAPRAALLSTFGASLDGPVADVVVRNWGALIALVGALLVYAANKPEIRPVALVLAGTSKATFIALVLSHGRLFLGTQAAVAVAVDLAWVSIFVAYLLMARRAAAAAHDPARPNVEVV